MNKNTFVGIAVLALALFLPQIKSQVGEIDLAKLLQPAATETQVDQIETLRLVCGSLSAKLPDLERIDSSNRVIELVDEAIVLSLGDAPASTEASLQINAIRAAVLTALGNPERSKMIDRDDRIKVAAALKPPAEKAK